MKKIAAMIIAAMAATSSGLAQNGPIGSETQRALVSNPRTIIPDFDPDSLGPVLTELGVTWQSGRDNAGNTLITANIGGEFVFYMQPTACVGDNNDRCIGLLTLAFFEGDANAQTVRAFNDRYHFARTSLNETGGALITRYDIADYGVARGNVASSVANFVYLANLLQSELSSAARTVSLEGYANDLSAGVLNNRALREMSGVKAHSVSAIESHQQSFDEATENILLLVKDKTMPRNKIRNIK